MLQCSKCISNESNAYSNHHIYRYIGRLLPASDDEKSITPFRRFSHGNGSSVLASPLLATGTPLSGPFLSAPVHSAHCHTSTSSFFHSCHWLQRCVVSVMLTSLVGHLSHYFHRCLLSFSAEEEPSSASAWLVDYCVRQ
jgi:hypothetical protein